MPLYTSKSKKISGVTSYKTGKDFIEVRFDKWLYTYSYTSAGKEIIETMKKLAVANEGLSTFISQQQPIYLKKEKLF